MHDDETRYVLKPFRYEWALEICNSYFPPALAPIIARHLVARAENWAADDFEEFQKFEGYYRYDEPQMRVMRLHIQRFRASKSAAPPRNTE